MTFAQPFSGYEILGRVGAGAMGTVFKARHRRLNRVVALKVLKPALARNKRFVDRLRREARIVASLDHPNIVKGYDLGEESGYHFFVMEFVEGRSLRELLTEWGAFPRDQVIDVAVQVASALDHALARGVIHRDIKPGNILIDERGKVKLTDMGLAKGPSDVTITRDGATVGTPQYISPEQARNPQEADVRSDLYSLGATLYHMATGVPPFRGDTMAEVIHQVLHQQPREATELDPEIGAGLSLVIRKLLAKRPSARYQQPHDLLEDLGRILRDEKPQVDVRVLQRAEAGRPRRRRWLVVGAAAAVVAVGVGYLLLGPGPDGPGPDGVASNDLEFRSQVLEEMAQRPDYAAKFAVLDRQLATIGEPARRAFLVDQRAVLETSLQTEIDRLFDGYVDREAETRAWLAEPEHWRATDGFFDVEIPRALRAAFGYRTESLPPRVREHVLVVRLPALRRHVDRWIRLRDDEYRAAHAAHLEDVVEPAWRGPIERDPPDFARAARELERALAEFHGVAGRPQLGQLPDALRAEITAAETQVRSAALKTIDRLAQGVAQALERELKQGLADLEARLDSSLSLAAVRTRYSDLERTLTGRYPPETFREEGSPWLAVRGDLRGFGRRLDGAQSVAEATELDRAVGLAYARLALTGRVEDALDWVGGPELTHPEMVRLREAHVRQLEAARDAAQAVWEELLGNRQRRVLALRGAGGPVQVELTRTRERCAMRVLAADGSELPVSAVSWRGLLSLASGGDEVAQPDDRARLRSGHAVWLALSGDVGDVPDFVDGDTERFYRDHVESLVERARSHRERGELSVIGVLQALNASLEAGDLAGVRGGLAAFGADYTDAALDGDARSLLRRARTWADREERRRQTDASLRSKLPAGVDVAVSLDDRVELRFDLASLASVPGWAASGGRLTSVGHDLALDEARRAALRPVTPFDGPSKVELTVRLRVPQSASGTLLYVFELHGAVLVFGILDSGAAVATIVPDGHAKRGIDLRNALQEPLFDVGREPPIVLLRDAPYELTFTVIGERGRRQVEARLGEVVLASATLSGVGERVTAAIVACQPLSIDELRVVATLDR